MRNATALEKTHDSIVAILNKPDPRTNLADRMFLGTNPIGNDIGAFLISNPSTKHVCKRPHCAFIQPEGAKYVTFAPDIRAVLPTGLLSL